MRDDPDSSDTVGLPEADRIEQRTPVIPDDDDFADFENVEPPIEADPTDVFEQHIPVVTEEDYPPG